MNRRKSLIATLFLVLIAFSFAANAEQSLFLEVIKTASAETEEEKAEKEIEETKKQADLYRHAAKIDEAAAQKGVNDAQAEIKRLQDRQKELDKEETDPKTSRKRKQEIEAEKKQTEEDLKGAKETLDDAKKVQQYQKDPEAQKKAEELDDKVAEQERELDKTRIDNKYNDLIKQNADVGKDLKGDKKEANTAYDLYLKARREYEKCMIDKKDEKFCNEEGASGDTPGYGNLMRQKGNEVRGYLKQFADEEIKNRQKETFPVSDVININPGHKVSFRTVANAIADWMLTLVSSVAVTALIIGGFLMIISGGDETRLELGKTIFTYSLIGLGITLLALGIITSIQSLFYNL